MYVSVDMYTRMHTVVNIRLWGDSLLCNWRNFNLTDCWTHSCTRGDPQTTLATHCQILLKVWICFCCTTEKNVIDSNGYLQVPEIEIIFRITLRNWTLRVVTILILYHQDKNFEKKTFVFFRANLYMIWQQKQAECGVVSISTWIPLYTS